MTYSIDELFYEPHTMHPEQDFEIDGIKVHFSYIAHYPHFDFYGDISETGYKSDFISQDWIDELGVEGLARERIKRIKDEFHKEKEKRLRKKKVKQ